MKEFRQLGPGDPDDWSAKLKMAAFVDGVIDTAPDHLHARGSLGPVISIPVFLQLAIIDTSSPLGHACTFTLGRNLLECRLTTYRGFVVIGVRNGRYNIPSEPGTVQRQRGVSGHN